MLDHVFTDAIGALRDAMENALLERQAFEEHFQSDVLLGDLTWETSYGLPGEGSPPRVRADITFDWPTWAQTAYRSWYIGEPADEPPRIEIEIVMRIQRLASSPDVKPSNCAISVPAMKAFPPAPRRIRIRIAGSWSTSSQAATSASYIAHVMALRASGRLNVRKASGP